MMGKHNAAICHTTNERRGLILKLIRECLDKLEEELEEYATEDCSDCVFIQKRDYNVQGLPSANPVPPCMFVKPTHSSSTVRQYNPLTSPRKPKREASGQDECYDMSPPPILPSEPLKFCNSPNVNPRAPKEMSIGHDYEQQRATCAPKLKNEIIPGCRECRCSCDLLNGLQDQCDIHSETYGRKFVKPHNYSTRAKTPKHNLHKNIKKPHCNIPLLTKT